MNHSPCPKPELELPLKPQKVPPAPATLESGSVRARILEAEKELQKLLLLKALQAERQQLEKLLMQKAAEAGKPSLGS